MRARSLWSALVLASLLLAAGCGEVPTAGPAGPATPPGPTGYPPPPTFPTRPPATAGPELTVTPSATATPTALPVPALEVQPVPAELQAGERIAFLRDGDLWLVRPDGSAETQVSTSGNVSAIFGWSWDNSRLLLGVTSYETGRPCGYPGWTDLWVLPTDGSSPRQITQGQSVVRASWSPVDLSLAYVGEGGLYVVNLGTAKPHRMEMVDIAGSPWSPDGTRLAVLIPRSEGGWLVATDIAVWNLQDGTVTNLTNTNDDPFPIRSTYPVWSVDGSRILFESDREVVAPVAGGYQLWYTMDSDGRDVRHLDTPALLRALNVVRSPVADRVVLNHGGEVWLLDFDGNMRKVGDTPWPCWAPYAWSPDGTRLALVEKGGKLVQVDLGSLTTVETIVETGSSPAWTH